MHMLYCMYIIHFLISEIDKWLQLIQVGIPKTKIGTCSENVHIVIVHTK